MKKLILTSAFLLLAAIAMASPVPQEKTLQLATFFFHEHGGHGDLQLVQNTPFDHMHIYQGAEGNGFVIISSDDRVFPILGYSATNPLDINNMGPNTRYWLDEYDNQIQWNIENNHEPAAEVREAWKRLEKMLPAPHHSPAITAYNTANLLTTTWDQSPYYNAQCPYDSAKSERVPTGCVTTAMGQIMKYWGHPLRGIGSHSYTDSLHGVQSADFADTIFNFSIMPDQLTSNSTADQVNAVALLLRRCYIAVEATNDSTGTSANTCGNGSIDDYSAENAYRRFFKYMHTLHSVDRSDYTDSAWIALMKNEINNGRPVQYSGFNAKGGDGHSFICCGYDNMGKLYFNWGWGGQYDGCFHVGQLNPGGDNFSYYNQAIIGIVPDTAQATQTTITLVADPQTAGTLLGAGTYTSYRDTVVILATATPGYLYDHWDVNNTFNPYAFIANGGNVTHTAHFSKMLGDTLGYCYDKNNSAYGYDESTTCLWAIRLDSNSIAPRKCLTRVNTFVAEAGEYNVHIFQGDSISSSTLVHSDTFDIIDSQKKSWVDITLTDSVRVNRNLPLWIALEWTGIGSPVTFSGYRGNPDGAWKSNGIDDEWVNYVTNDNSYIALMIRGVFADCSEHPSSVYVTESDASHIYVNGQNLIVENAEGLDIRIYDATGKLVTSVTAASDRESITLATGVYFVRTNGKTDKLIIK